MVTLRRTSTALHTLRWRSTQRSGATTNHTPPPNHQTTNQSLYHSAPPTTISVPRYHRPSAQPSRGFAARTLTKCSVQIMCSGPTDQYIQLPRTTHQSTPPAQPHTHHAHRQDTNTSNHNNQHPASSSFDRSVALLRTSSMTCVRKNTSKRGGARFFQKFSRFLASFR